MKLYIRMLAVFVLLGIYSGCSVIRPVFYPDKTQHNVPDKVSPNFVSSTKAEAFVDQNGSFFPDKWESLYGSHNSDGAYSLRAIAKLKSLEKELSASQDKILQNLEDYVRDKSRVFILVHGYNNGDALSRNNYGTIEQKIQAKESDAIIEFYWDGLESQKGDLGSLAVWFYAAGYSQLAGAEGLRKILNRIHDKDIYMISHSRGASVLLSALSNPPYGKKFALETMEYHGVDVNSARLLDNQNRIKLLMLAPAIGRVDFGKITWYDEPNNNKTFRDLSNQLVSISYTVNTCDQVLNKFIGIRKKFNPTELGSRAEAGDIINMHYQKMKTYPVQDPSQCKHDFSEYIQHKSFVNMLKDAGVI